MAALILMAFIAFAAGMAAGAIGMLMLAGPAVTRLVEIRRRVEKWRYTTYKSPAHRADAAVKEMKAIADLTYRDRSD